jgi:hypothetical protein
MTVSAARLREMATDPAVFRKHVMIDTDKGPRAAAELHDDWQVADFTALDPAWKRVSGVATDSNMVRAWLERPRGHSKTSDTALMILWVVAFALRRLRGVAAAADLDQARLIRDAIDSIVRLNPWLSAIIDVQRNAVENTRTGSRLDIITADAKSSYGILPDFIVCDELTHWPGRELWDSLLSSAAKRSHCLTIVITNAGHLGTWQHETRKAVLSSGNWHSSILDGPRASWITTDILDEQRRLLPELAYRRLWLNAWTSGTGDALDPDDVDAAIDHELSPLSGHMIRDPNRARIKDLPYLGPADDIPTRNEIRYSFVAGLDLGIRNDHCALVVLATDAETQRIQVADVRSWAPTTGRDIDLIAVEAAIREAHHRFRFSVLRYDPYQAALMAQRLQRSGIHCQEVPFSGKNLDQMASTLLEVFRNRRIDIPGKLADGIDERDDPFRRLVRDLLRLTIVEKSFGFKLESTRDEEGHADTATALAIALSAALRASPSTIHSVCNPIEIFRESTRLHHEFLHSPIPERPQSHVNRPFFE